MRSRATLSLPTTQRRKLQRQHPPFMPRVLFLATLFSAFFLVHHFNTRPDLLLRSSGVPVERVIPGRSLFQSQDIPSVRVIKRKPQLSTTSSPTKVPPVQVSKSQTRSAAQKHRQKQSRSSRVAKRQPSPGRDPADFSTFDRSTALNYFHMHKTGGVSFKERLFDFFINQTDAPARKAKVFDTCHTSKTTRNELGLEKEWSCDWDQIANLSLNARNSIDVIVGHQYWERGAEYWIPDRDVRYFTVMRHPLHRKISFFYHFFVRNSGRKEDSVTRDELIDFILGKRMPRSPLVRDAGPGYYASRLWSDGWNGYDEHRFAITDKIAGSIMESSIRKLRNNFVFIGLQTQEPASLCMLQRTVEAFVEAHGFGYKGGFQEISRQRTRMNTGSYSLSAERLWKNMSQEQRKEYQRVEKVDLGIYGESVKMFHEMVRRFGCDDLAVESEDDEIAL